MGITLLAAVTTLGWCGAIITVGAYALVTQRRLKADSAVFAALNAVGACLLTVSAVAHTSWPSAASNLVWAFIAVAALVRGGPLTGSRLGRGWRRTRTQVAHLRIAARSDHESDRDDKQAA